ncbi:MAG: hypothetical protein WCP86_06645 [bacterium]
MNDILIHDEQTSDMCDEDCLAPYTMFQDRLLSLDGVSARECADMHRAIATLQLMESDIREFVSEVDMHEIFGMEREDVDNLIAAYSHQLKRLKEKEGVNFDASSESLANCVRLAVLFRLFMYGWCKKLCPVRLSSRIIGLIEDLPA